MAKIIIDGKELEVDVGTPLIQACELAGVEIPRFCYHDRLRIAGNCRMCLVEVEKSPKPVASCAMPVAEGMVVHTNSPSVQKAREGVMEFLLINHPLDCPICDKGGECDLQDQAFKYGRGSNRFRDNKRAVRDKNMGPLIQTHMTRCIHCTRCIRFMTDVAGVPELGATGRGEHMEVTSYLEKALTSEVSGNIIDLCPVGALNSKPYAYTARKWELKSTYSIDVFDAMGSNIMIDSRGLEVMRILPRVSEEINEEWISDKTRFSYDGLKRQRIDTPFVRVNGKLSKSNWETAISFIKDKFHGTPAKDIGAIAGAMADCESMYAMKVLLQKVGSANHDFNENCYYLDYSSRGNYLFNSGYSGIEDADLIFIVGADLRKKAPVLNARITKRDNFADVNIFTLGVFDNQTFRHKNLGSDFDYINEILEGKSKIGKDFEKAKNPIIIVGDGIYGKENSLELLSQLEKLAKEYGFIREGWNGFNILLNEASATGAIELGFTPVSKGSTASEMAKKVESEEISILFLLGADDIEIAENHKGMVVYIGHHGDRNAHIADVILPSCAFTEKNATYVNNEGRIQSTLAAVQPIGKAMEDWKVIHSIAKSIGIELGFASLNELRSKMASTLPGINLHKEKVSFKTSKPIKKSGKNHIVPIKVNFYLNNSISRSSKTMANCAKEFGLLEGAL